MRYIANILTDGKFEDAELFNVVSASSDLINGIPTLIIGRNKTTSLYPEASIIDWKIDNKVYWTFGMRERRDRMDRDVKRFRKIVMDSFVKSVKYTFFDILTATREKKELFINSLKDNTHKTVFTTNDMMYIYYESENQVIGISLRDIEYENGNKKKIFSIIYSSPSITFLKNTNSLTFNTKSWLRNNLYVIPYLLS